MPWQINNLRIIIKAVLFLRVKYYQGFYNAIANDNIAGKTIKIIL